MMLILTRHEIGDFISNEYELSYRLANYDDIKKAQYHRTGKNFYNIVSMIDNENYFHTIDYWKCKLPNIVSVYKHKLRKEKLKRLIA